jgi:hydroxymethylglutaryl-CoA reductase
LTSRIPGFYRLPPRERLQALHESGGLSSADADIYASDGLDLAAADVMVENVISTFRLPNAVACNLTINGVDRLVPMVVEEPSVVAAVSNMARVVRCAGGFEAEADPSVMIGQIQLPAVADPDAVAERLRAALPALRALGEGVHPRLVERGGGLVGFEVRTVRYDEPGRPAEDMVVLHVLLDCVDAMGANMINTLCEHLAPHVEAITGCPVGLRILSNLADRRLTRARCAIPFAQLAADADDGRAVAEGVAAAWRFAWADPYRAATHNKGILNGIDALALATGNDWRAIEAGAHAYAARDGQYRPLSRWEVRDGALHGALELPMQVGTVGGPIRVHPTVQANLRLLRCDGARDLAAVAAAVGLAQNLGALRALAVEGIQAGHMRMHARTVAATAGAHGDEIARVTAALVEARDFSVDRAAAILASLRGA